MKPQLAFFTVETVVHDRQADYYASLAAADRQADVAPFAEFILQAILDGMTSSPTTAQVSDQVKALLSCMDANSAVSAGELMKRMNLSHKATFRKNYLNPALVAGLVEMTEPNSPRSPTQKYKPIRSCKKFHLPTIKSTLPYVR